MSILIKTIKIIDPSSPYHNKVVDVYIEKDQIKEIGESLQYDAQRTVEGEGLLLTPGWVALNCNFNDPGKETSETIVSGSAAAQYSGFTSVILNPDTEPIADSKSTVDYIYKQSEGLSTQHYVLGALSKNGKNEEMAELYDMQKTGVVGFFSGKSGISNANLLKLGLLYNRTLNVPTVVFPNEAKLSDHGQVNEGVVSTYLGLKGIPSISEEISISRDLAIAEYCESMIHFTGVSSAKSVQLIKEAKEKGIEVTCSVNLYNLLFNDDVLEEYDTNYKVIPPIRTEADRNALIEGLKEGTIDCISLDHLPMDVEYKACEFDLAKFGMRSLETALGAIGNSLLKELGWDLLNKVLSTNPREIFDLPKIRIKEGEVVELSIIDPKAAWSLNPKDIGLKSFNNPLLQTPLKTKCTAIISHGKYWSN